MSDQPERGKEFGAIDDIFTGKIRRKKLEDLADQTELKSDMHLRQIVTDPVYH
jgi:hypothetical protein